MRAFKTLSTAALSSCWAEILEESSLLQINHLKGDVDSDCFREGRCGPGSTTAAPPLAESGICTVTGDPHIKTFDSEEVNVNYYYNGDFHLVKSKFINIQARYWSSAQSGKSSVKALAIGGDIMEGRVLMIEPGNGVIRLDGQEVQLAESGSMTIGTGTLSSEPAAIGEKKGPLLTLSFPDDDVSIKVKRLTELLNTIIEMRPETDQDGHCGNFNGVLEDDDLQSIKARMGTPLRFPETMFPVMAATLLGCSQQPFGVEVGMYLNTHECNMMCSQRGSEVMVNKDETCYCGDGTAPAMLESCQMACEDPEIADPGFCIYSMAKPASNDFSKKCVLNENMVVEKCTKAMTSPADIESCKIDVCASGDLKGTLSYMLDWKAIDQKERKKLAAMIKKEKNMSAADRKKQADKRNLARAKKAESTKNHRLKKNAQTKARKEKERATSENRKKVMLKKSTDANKQEAAKEKAQLQKLHDAKMAKNEKEKSEQEKKAVATTEKRQILADAKKLAASKKAAQDKKEAMAAKAMAEKAAAKAKIQNLADAKKNKAAKAKVEQGIKADAAKATADKQRAQVQKQKAAAIAKKKAELAKHKAERATKESRNKVKP